MFARKLLVAALSAAAVVGVANAETFKVQVDQTIPLRLNAPAHTVVLGNATIVDVALHDPMTLLVTGKAYGATNLLVLDEAGRSVYSNTVAVANNEAVGELTINTGGKLYTYSCLDKCRATPKVGDDGQFYGEIMSSVSTKTAAAQGH
ncbi:MAG: pilus assembly protein N-terminal domain-containing protein [Hyphomonadaceae bacterium]